MKINIRSKLTLAISLLMVVVFAVAAVLFIQEKKTEMADDIYHNVLAFASMTASQVTDSYDLYLAQNSFVYFNKEIQSLFEKNNNISAIKIISFNGDILYDSEIDVDKKYEGNERIASGNLIEQVQSENFSLETLDESIYFLKIDNNGNIFYLDKFERHIDALEIGTFIDYLIIPASQKYSVLYKFDYKTLQERVSLMIERIIYLALFGILLGVVFSFLMSSKITRPVSELVFGVKKIAKGDFKARVDITTKDEIGFLGESFNAMAKDLEFSVEAKVYKERVTRELELAMQIQDQLIPDEEEIPEIDGIDISAGLIPAEEIGGDIYDFIKVGKDKLLMYLGDVTGHGVPAGIVSSISSALFYGYSDIEDLKQIIVNVNRVLDVKMMPNMFLTLCLLEWDSLNKKLSYVNAGHEQLIHSSFNNKRTNLLEPGGIALGMVNDITPHVKINTVELAKGDFLIVYSDGIPESWRNEKENYGVERLVKFVEEASKTVKTAKEMKEAILKDVKEFAAGYKQMDDITIIVIKRV